MKKPRHREAMVTQLVRGRDLSPGGLAKACTKQLTLPDGKQTGGFEMQCSILLIWPWECCLLVSKRSVLAATMKSLHRWRILLPMCRYWRSYRTQRGMLPTLYYPSSLTAEFWKEMFPSLFVASIWVTTWKFSVKVKGSKLAEKPKRVL